MMKMRMTLIWEVQKLALYLPLTLVYSLQTGQMEARAAVDAVVAVVEGTPGQQMVEVVQLPQRMAGSPEVLGLGGWVAG